MKLRFTNLRQPGELDELSPLQQQQLQHCGSLWDGQDLPAASRMGMDADMDEETSFGGFLALWDLLDEAGNLVYEAWFYMVDSGTIFKAGTLDVVAEVIQFGLECGDTALEAALLEARDHAFKTLGADAKEIVFHR